MTCKDLTYRIIKIGKTTCSVAVIGFLIMGGGVASAETFNAVSYGTTIAPALSTNSIDLIYYNNNNSSNTDSGAATINLAPGVNLTGETVTGSGATSGLAVFSREVRDNVNSANIDRFSLTGSTLNLGGNNTLTGLVGVQVKLDSNTTGNFYGSYIATPLSVTNINGPSVTFNRQLFSNQINLNTGASVNFLGDVGDSSNTTTLDYKGNNASVTINNGINFYGSMVNVTSNLGDKTNGSLYLLGSSTITGAVGDATSGLSLVRLSGSGSTVNFGNGLTTDWLDYAVSSTVNVTGSLIMNTDAAPGAVHAVRFNDSDGTLNLLGGDLAGVVGTAVVSTSVNNRGTLTIRGSTSPQTVTGGLGAANLALKLVNVGDTAIQNASSLTVNGNIFATTVALNNDGATTHSNLRLGSGYSLTATNLITDANGMGRLYLVGGTQTIDARVGSSSARLDLVSAGVNGSQSTFTQAVDAATVENSGTGSSTFRGAVTATNVNVNAGTSQFDQAVTATNLTITSGSGTFGSTLNAGTTGSNVNKTVLAIGSGTGTFNGATDANLSFTGAGTANLNQGLTGTVAFAGQAATVNLADGKTITGAVSTTTLNTGTLRALGDGTLAGTVGAANMGIASLLVNTNDQQSTSDGLLAQASIWAGQTSLQNDGKLTLANGTSLTGTDGSKPALVTSTHNTGALRLAGSSTVSGGIGEATKALRLIDASLSQATTNTFNGAVYAQTIKLDSDNKTATFNDAVTATTVQAGGAGSSVQFQQGLNTHTLEFSSGSTAQVTVTGANLTLTANGSAPGQVKFNGTDSTLNLTNVNLVGQAGALAVSTTANNTGTLNLQSTTAQTVTGGLGEAEKGLARINIGTGTKTALTIDGDVFATTTQLSNDSRLTLASGRSLTGANVTTAAANTGELVLAGGTQAIDARVGSSAARLSLVRAGVNGSQSTFTQAVDAATVENSGTGSSTFRGAVTATNVNVNAGTSQFDQAVTATNLTITSGSGTFGSTLNAGTTGSNVNKTVLAIGSGTGTFNGATDANLSFTGAGTANLNQGLTGTVAFAGQAATVNLGDGKSVSGVVSTATTNNSGSLQALGDGTLQSTVGATNMGIAELRVNSAGTQNTTQGLLAQGDIFAGQTTLANSGTLTLATGKNLTGTDTSKTAVVTTANNTGVLRLEGSSTITGGVGESGAALKRVEAGVAGSTVTLDGTTFTESLELSSTGTVRLEGTLTGKVDFKRAGGTVELANNLNLNTGTTTFANANAAALRFAGSSTVTGQLGSANNDNENQLKDVYAGVNGSVVTFQNDVYLKSTTLHVVGTGVVNLQGSLYAPIQFDLNGNGSVNVGSGQQVTGTVTTVTAGTGTINFVGDATTANTLGSSAAPLAAVNFHAATTDATNLPLKNAAATINVGHNIYANTTTVGNANQNTTLNITASGLNLGTALTLGSRTTLNTAGAVTRSASVEFGHSRNADGSLTPSATVTRSTTGTGTIRTGGATLNFAVATEAWSGNAGGLVSAAASSSITGGAGSTLTMTGNETVHAALLGSMRNDQRLALIGVSSGAGSQTGTLFHNSYVMNPTLSRDANGSLLLKVSRDANTYITQSGTQGHFSNPAANRLGALAAAGTGYGQDMQTVLNKLDLDQWGYGNNQANLATQVQRLAPVANRSYGMAMLDASSVGMNHIGDRLKDLRSVEASGDTKPKSVWLRNGYSDVRQDSVSGYDGFKNTYTGITLGGDTRPDARSMVGLAVSYGTTRIKQSGLRQGDAGDVKSLQFTVYGAYDVTDQLYADAMFSTVKQDINGYRASVIDRVARTEHSASGQTFKLNLGYRLPVSQSTMVFTPVLSYESLSVREDAYAETGAGDVGLQFDGQRHRRSQLGIGLRLGGTTQGLGGLVIKPDLGVTVLKDSSANHADKLTTRYVGGGAAGTGFTTDMARVGSTTMRYQLGLGILMSKTSSLSVRYQLDQRSNYKADAAELMLRWDF